MEHTTTVATKSLAKLPRKVMAVEEPRLRERSCSAGTSHQSLSNIYPNIASPVDVAADNMTWEPQDPLLLP